MSISLSSSVVLPPTYTSSINKVHKTISLSRHALELIALYVISPEEDTLLEPSQQSEELRKEHSSPKDLLTEEEIAQKEYNKAASELVLCATSPEFRIACEMAHYRFEIKEPCIFWNVFHPRVNSWQLYFNCMSNERYAIISDLTRMEMGKWWLLRSISTYTKTPYPLRCIEFCSVKGNNNESIFYSLTESNSVYKTSLLTKLITNTRVNENNAMCSLLHLCKSNLLSVEGNEYSSITARDDNLELSLLAALNDEAMLPAICGLQTLLVNNYHLVRSLPITSLVELKKVNFSGTGMNNRVVLDLAYTCHKLEELNINGCTQINSFVPLAQLRELRVLKLGATNVRDEELGSICESCVKLTHLDTHNCVNLMHFTHISMLTQIRELNVSSTHINAKALLQIAKLPLLETFLMRRIAQIDELALMIAWIDEMEANSVYRCKYHIRSIEPQFFSCNIHTLDCSEFAMPKCMFDSICYYCQHLERLYINVNSSSVLFDYTKLRTLKLLKELDVSGTCFDDSGLASLQQSTNLTTLNVQGCQYISNFHHIANLQGKLKCLTLSDTLITSEGLAAIVLAHARSLRKLYIHCCRLLRNCSSLLELVELKEIGVGGLTLNEDWLENLRKLAEKGVCVTTQLSLLVSIE